MKRFALLLLLVPAAALGQSAAPTTLPAHPAIPGVSAVGMAVVEKYRGPNDPDLTTLFRQQRTVHQQLIAATLAATIDPDKLAGLIKQDDAAQAAVRAHLSDQLIAALRELPQGDRAPFIRAFIHSAQPAAH